MAQTTYNAGQKVKTLHLAAIGLQTVYHDSMEQAIKFSGEYADSYICMHKRHGSGWNELFKDQRGNPRRQASYKQLKLN